MSRAPAHSPTELLPRYRQIIPEWQLFEEACARPMPQIIRVNTLRIASVDLRRRLTAAGVPTERLPWDASLLQVGRPLGRRIEHWLGLFYIQEATQAVPVRVLNPQPGECILDLCASPGGKSTQIAARMHNRGSLIANEPSGGRQQSLLANINRLGVLNATVTEYRGESFPMRARFDRVLVDAPCSAEGTLRKESRLTGGAPIGTIRRLSRLQKRLILRAYDLLCPGGALTYSTCTLAPEENEEVIAHLLDVRNAHVAPIDLPFSAAPGLTEWAGTSYPDTVRGCARIYPHHIDSGGGFIAHVRRPA